MDFFNVFGDLAGGFATALQPFNIFMLFVGVMLGLVVGVLPGLGGTSAVAILLPITVIIARTSPTSAVILLAGVYWGALFGGVVTSILFNIPGEPWSVVLLFDGFPLAKRRGKPGVALASSFFASFVGAFLATVMFTFFARALADFALSFGPPELFAVFVMSFATLIGLGAESPVKAVMMIGFGLLLAAVGLLHGNPVVPPLERVAGRDEQGTGLIRRGFRGGRVHGVERLGVIERRGHDG